MKKKFKTKTKNSILITGCAGFIGSNLVDFLLKKNFKIIGIDNLSTGNISFLSNALKNKRFSFVKQDLLNFSKIKKYFKGVDMVFHLSANADVRFGPKHPKKDIKQNLLVTSNVLEAMRINNVKKIIFSSTGSVYGEARQFPTPEESIFPVQTSLYGASKLACEGLIESYVEAFQMQCWIFRFVSVLGPRYSHGHVKDFFIKIIKNQTIDVLGNGFQKKSYIHVQDCIGAIYRCIRYYKNKVNILNIGNNNVVTVRQSLKKIQTILKNKSKAKYQKSIRGWIGDNPFILLCIKKLKKTGWKPKFSIMQSVEDTVFYLMKNHSKKKK